MGRIGPRVPEWGVFVPVVIAVTENGDYWTNVCEICYYCIVKNLSSAQALNSVILC